MKYKLKLRNAESIIFDECQDDIRRDHSDDYFAMSYLIQCVLYDKTHELDGLILKEHEIKEFEINFDIDVFVNNEDEDEIASFTTDVTITVQVAIGNDGLHVNVKPFTFEEKINASNLDNYDGEIDDKTFIKAIKELLSDTDLNAHNVKLFMQKDVLSFEQLDD